MVFLKTFSESSERQVRQMTNLNEDPYSMMWFTSDTKSRKVDDVKRDPRVIISFPSGKLGKLFEIEGKAQLERRELVEQKWSGGYLYWRLEQEDNFWFPWNESHREWSIINVFSTSARLLKSAPV